MKQRLIEKSEIQACKGMKRGEAAVFMKVPESSLRHYVTKYKMQGFFPRCVKGPKIAKEVYLEGIGQNINDIARRLKVSVATVRNHLNYYKIEGQFSIISKRLKKVVEEDSYFRQVEFSCMTEGCRETFRKPINNDVSDKRAAGMRFRCSSCNGNIGSATTYSYSGQGES